MRGAAGLVIYDLAGGSNLIRGIPAPKVVVREPRVADAGEGAVGEAGGEVVVTTIPCLAPARQLLMIGG